MDLTSAVALYLDEKHPTLSVTTLRWYEHKLRIFVEWCEVTGEAKETEDLQAVTFSRFLTHLEETGSTQYGRMRSSYTRRGYAQVFRQWTAYLTANGLAAPMHIVRIRADIKIIQTFTDEHLKALFKAATQEKSEKLVARDHAILSLLLDTGIRASELCGLKLDQIEYDRTQSYLHVYGKGRKEREVAFGSRTKKALAMWVNRYRMKPTTRDPGYVFTNDRNDPLTPDGLDQMLYRLRDRAGGPEAFPGVRVSAHTFRHTFAVRSLERGVDVYTLSRVLGHTSVTTTQEYLKDFSQRSARKAVGSLLDMQLWLS
jgi:site-specific recombinase XerD